MVETSAEASSALGQSTSQANAALIQLQSDFTLAKQNFQEQLLQDIDLSAQKAQSFLERFVNGMDAAVQKATARVLSGLKETESSTASLAEASAQ